MAGGQQPSQSSQVSVDQLAGSLSTIFGLYMQVEQNQRVKGDTEQKFNIMMERMQGNKISQVTLEKIDFLVTQIKNGQTQGRQAAMRDLTSKCWPDIKEFSNALKVLSNFKDQYQVGQ